ncbi:large subunit ribosomal protein L6 [Candidatus Kinetoplastibacterium blastocrithidii TCC012E]|uniref:Large ribosomal subunit protein uL6 n=1 Tax=Candidatus Kinetoplastidibacterium blastocrithidiae TCC012E TaxID=1208922 RepID=M1M1J7_9PROT|nr:50S ribosomal protein L6 [Candidatus Kinetoplastibacterium blastocrithidii]AFZ83323.1 large subunit ribosomal protein L6 [Candidatus Kinetoplastibacterium blastocrithidii (ex Strigomonas culicis)]AGF50141.1 large subunit ribosomal protein L6 [Candidatus Kinetoplastibacterium blastocrithidii TCC012E]
MSRIAKYPIDLPNNVEAKIEDNQITIKGPLGSLTQFLVDDVKVDLVENKIVFSIVRISEQSKAMIGTLRALISNMVIGVSRGFERKLVLVGVGFRASVQESVVKLQLGFSHDVLHQLPSGIIAESSTPTELVIKGIDKQSVGQVAAKIRSYRPPEPYKGKGVRYADERVVLKEAKKK